jgi:hypothetical protein
VRYKISAYGGKNGSYRRTLETTLMTLSGRRRLDCGRTASKAFSVERKSCAYGAKVWRYFRRRPGAAPVSASKAIAKAASSPRASAPPLAASTRLPTPALFGSFENPATQPIAASGFSKSSPSQCSAPRPSFASSLTLQGARGFDDAASELGDILNDEDSPAMRRSKSTHSSRTDSGSSVKATILM